MRLGTGVVRARDGQEGPPGMPSQRCDEQNRAREEDNGRDCPGNNF